MGCCESCLGNSNKDYDGDGPRETDPLINPANGQTPHHQFGEPHTTPKEPIQQPKRDEQSALSRILHKTASDTVDVSATEGRGIEQHEFHDKARQYSNRVNMVLASSGSKRQLKVSLPNGVTAPQIVLASQPISLADIELITTAALKASQAMKEVRVEHKEDLVVPFNVP